METQSVTKPGAKIVTISAVELNHKSNYQDFGRYVEADIAVVGDPEATLPELIEAVKKLITPDRKSAFEARGKKIAEENRIAHQRDVEQAALAFDASPVSTARVAAELWAQIKNEDWSLVSNDRHSSSLADAPVELHQAVSVHRRAGRREASATTRPLPSARRSPIASMGA